MRRSAQPLAALVAITGGLIAGCGPSAPPLDLPSGCQPLLGGAECLLPYPLVEENRVHDAVRSLPAARAQMQAFFREDSAVVHPCDGVCDPE